MSITATLLPARDYRRERWRNQQGWTREIIRAPDTETFDWRASIAEISHDTVFSPYPGFRRAQVLLQGEELQLGFTDGRRLQLTPPYQHTQFDGSDVAACHLPCGPVHVFNVIWNPSRIDLELLHRPLVGPMIFLPSPGTEWFIYLLTGHAQVRGDTALEMAAGDSLLLRPARSERLVLEGGGEILLLRVSQVSIEPSETPDLQLTPPATT